MLDELSAVNLGLIEQATLRLDDGLTVITGETGAGKTLMLGAIRLLRGDKATKGLIGPFHHRCEVAGRFVTGERELVVRRSIDGSRSRAYVDDSLSSVAGLTEATKGTMSVVGQHDQLSLTTSRGVRSLIDASLDRAGLSARERYAEAWSGLAAIEDEIAAIGGDLRAIEREHDSLTYQVDEIDTAELAEGEEAHLEATLTRLRNAEGLREEVADVLALLGDDGASRSMDSARSSLARATDLDADLTTLLSELDELLTRLNELTGSIAVYASDIDADPRHLAEHEDRMARFNELKRKYGASVEDVLTFRKEAAQRRDELSALLLAAEDIEDRLAVARSGVADAGEALRSYRQASADRTSATAVEHLSELGFSEPVVEIDVDPADPSSFGCDRPTIRFASSRSLTPAPVSAIASGGELSRLVLALTLASGAADAAVVAFDEIDAGVGGTTALSMGAKLSALAADRQVICVTHLPQVAAYADTHFVVTRADERASIRRLDADERVDEITRMLAGLSDSEKGRDHARELLASAGR